MLTAEEAHRRWRYDPETGHFFWRIRPMNTIVIGSRAGSFDGKYWALRFEKKDYSAARVAWLMMTGSWPAGQIDHKNRDKTDDRFANLREATLVQNSYNRMRKKKNKVGVKGVHPSAGDRYRAIIRIDGKNKNLGFYGTIDEAKAAYDAAAKQHHGEFASL